jgi:hypothetical protein
VGCAEVGALPGKRVGAGEVGSAEVEGAFRLGVVKHEVYSWEYFKGVYIYVSVRRSLS